MCKYSVWPVGVPRFHVHGVLGIAKRWGFPGVGREEGREKNLTFVEGQDRHRVAKSWPHGIQIREVFLRQECIGKVGSARGNDIRAAVAHLL